MPLRVALLGDFTPPVHQAGADPAGLVKDMVPARLLPKLRRMVELMLQAEYAPAQEGYISSRSRAIQQVRALALGFPQHIRHGHMDPKQTCKVRLGVEPSCGWPCVAVLACSWPTLPGAFAESALTAHGAVNLLCERLLTPDRSCLYRRKVWINPQQYLQAGLPQSVLHRQHSM